MLAGGEHQSRVSGQAGLPKGRCQRLQRLGPLNYCKAHDLQMPIGTNQASKMNLSMDPHTK